MGWRETKWGGAGEPWGVVLSRLVRDDLRDEGAIWKGTNNLGLLPSFFFFFREIEKGPPVPRQCPATQSSREQLLSQGVISPQAL
jgi:hypothetical protein